MKRTALKRICSFMLALTMLSCVMAANITQVVWAEPDTPPGETTAPEMETSETTTPEMETSETTAPEMEPAETTAPETEPAETTAPEMKPAETTAPETEPAETTVPEMEPAETTAPEMEPSETTAPETEPAETTVPEMEPAETTVPEMEPSETTAPETEPTETTAPETKPSTFDDKGKSAPYIYFDLAAGQVTIDGSTYTGYIYETKDGDTTKIKVTGTHVDSNHYYVFQSTDSNKSTVGLVDGVYVLPTYGEMYVDGESWGSFITDNTSVLTVVSSWSPAASAVGRTATANRIEINGTKAGQYNITIDNLWSSYITSSTSRTTGGLSFYPTVNNAHATVYLKGNSRFGNIHYSSDFDNNRIFFEEGGNGTLTVASEDGSSNHYNSVIGGNDSGAAGKESSKGIVINGGTIFAGARVKDNCTAIGGGGNGHGIVTINGGVVTAVVSSSGAAIGGGIGESSQGGRATIYLNGGQIYAYNFGFISEKSEGNFPIPAAAIGGGSTCLSEGTMADIFITGGNIYARSVGGAAIGGGSSTTKKGGNATIVISGSPIIDALSVGGVVYAKSGLSKTVEPGISIGGGTAGAGGTANGGYADLTISGGTLKTGSIGGGACNNSTGKFGHAIVTVTGGDIQGQIIMEKGTKDCVFNMSGGTIDNADSGDYNFIKENGGAVYINDPNGKATISAGTIINCSAENGGAVYMSTGEFILSGGTITASEASNYGGAVYLGGGTVTLSGGTISDCSSITGGAIYLAGGDVNISGTTITSCYAEHSESALGGAIYVTGGDVFMSEGIIEKCYTAKPGQEVYTDRINGFGGALYITGGKMEMTGGTIVDCSATAGGAIYLPGGNFNMTGGKISSNDATKDGGGVYLAGGSLTIDGESAIIEQNTAVNGAGVYLTGGTPGLYCGTLSGNIASGNGGGIFIDKQVVELKPTGTVTFDGNKAIDGAGMYILGDTENPAGFTVEECQGRVVFKFNVATANGGGVCIDNGAFTIRYNNIDIINNTAKNGGGVAVLSGNFDMYSGVIGESEKSNKATNGGGVYVAGGVATINGGTVSYNIAACGGGAYVSGGNLVLNEGGSFYSNAATYSSGVPANGGGFYVYNGSFTMNGGTIAQNTASDGNGGGGYIDGGNFIMKEGTIGGNSFSDANTAENGGGIYVSDGNVTILKGNINNNRAQQDGGAIYVSSETTDVNVNFLSGNLINNHALSGNGGGIAVQSTSSKTITVKIGCLLDHSVMPFDYVGEYEMYAADGKHESCPYVAGNIAHLNGGGFYINSSSSYLYYYCIEEDPNNLNIANGNTSCYSIDVEGGVVVIGDKPYHDEYPNLRSEPWGNVRMYSTVLVNDGAVDIYGDMDNPYFAQKITVDIKSSTGHFVDHRRENKGAVNYYKIHYWENFQGGGKYIASQYPVVSGECWVDISGAMFDRPGYKIIGWVTGNNIEYLVGTRIDLTKLTAEDGMGLKNALCTCKDDDFCLVLYAVWDKKGYVIEFDPNNPYGATCTGEMKDLPCTQGQPVTLPENKFKCEGYKFLGWALSPTATKINYADKAEVIDLTLEDSKPIPLYAVWEKCNHVGTLKYTVENGNTIVESCEACGGHTVYAYLDAYDVDYDAQPHPATVSGDFGTNNWLGPVPSILYVKDKDSTWDDADVDGVWSIWGTPTDSVPKYAGTYTASLTVGDATAGVRFTIERIKWVAPGVPEFVSVEVDGKKGIQITPPTIDESLIDTPTYEYSSERVINGNVEPNSLWSTDKFIPTEHSNTYYYIYARLKADRNHIESDSSQYVKYLSDNASVEFLLDTGIMVTEANIEGNNSFTFKASPDTGYHKNNWSVTVYTENPHSNPEAQGSGLTSDDKDQYILNLASSDVTYYVRIKGVATDAEFESKATYDQVFVNFTDVPSFSISRDSSFTVQYTMKNFTPSEYDVPSVKFYLGDESTTIPSGTKVIPSGTKVIMVKDGSYWYCVTSSATSILNLGEFKKMGGSGNFVYERNDTIVSSTYQFIFDFSDAQTMPVGNSLKVQFAAERSVDEATKLDMVREIGLADEAIFRFDVTLDNKATIKYTYNKSDGYASIWNNREAAIVITLEGEIPEDIVASVSVGGQFTDYAPHKGNMFIIPCGALVNGESTIVVQFESELVNVLDNVNVSISWMVSDTIADKAPLNGTEVGKALFENKSLTLAEAPALRITGITTMDSDVGEIRLCKIDSSYQVTVATRNIPNEWEITMYLYRKDTTVGSTSEGQFIYTGFYQVLSGAAKPELSLRGQEEGTFYLYVVATKGENANRVIMLEDKYFFIAEE